MKGFTIKSFHPHNFIKKDFIDLIRRKIVKATMTKQSGQVTIPMKIHY